MFGLNRLRRWWIQHILLRERIPQSLWRQVLGRVPLLARLPQADVHRLRRLASLFLHEKVVVGAGEFELDELMRVTIAAQACLLVLNLGLDYFDGWSEVIVYPDAFVVPHTRRDEAGVVHEGQRGLSGEAWGRGPVILSWSDIRADAGRHHPPGSNVVLHEFAHKLDYLNGTANGMPPLHPDIVRERWTEDFTRAYEGLYQQVRHHHRTAINAYASESPAEFFAVVTEYFFEAPETLYAHYPAVYDEMRRFYRQEPLAWAGNAGAGA